MSINEINVFLNIKELYKVGRLAYRDHTVYFEYDVDFIKSGIEISPFKLPLKIGIQQCDSKIFEGLPGVFNDSLPDGWGRLLLDRAVRAYGVLPNELTSLDRLSYVGKHGMGALVYEPENGEYHIEQGNLDLDVLAQQSQNILQGQSEAVLDEMLMLNGSSAGARPKAMIGLSKDQKKIIHGTDILPTDFEYWLVKFPNASETRDSGAIEYVYSQMARLAGIEIMDTHLLPAKDAPGYFTTKRFDRNNLQRLHIHSASGLLHTDFRTPCLDYQELIKATHFLTKDKQEASKVFRLAVFNVLAHNQDDHSKNFSFLMNEKGSWRFAPAYDLTFSSGLGGEQSTMVMGKGKQISKDDLIALGKTSGIAQNEIKTILNDVSSALEQWKKLAKNAGVSNENIKWVAENILN